MRDVKDMGQQMGYRSLEWNWPKEAMNRPIWAGIVDGAKLFPVFDHGRYPERLLMMMMNAFLLTYYY